MPFLLLKKAKLAILDKKTIKSDICQTLNKNFIMLKILLFPFAIMYDLITKLRNFLYDRGIFESKKFEVKTICVGNLTVGGTGKTPLSEYLIRFLQKKYKIAVLSRGYGRKTKGFLLANPSHSASDIGDEPMQFFQKFDQISVAVCEKRVLGINHLIFQKPDIELIILDDAFQHRAVRAGFYILISDFNRPFYEDFVLPAGRLRESRSNAKRSDLVVVSKCPKYLKESEKNEIKAKILPYIRKNTPIFFTSIQYLKPISIFNHFTEVSQKIILLTGIANTTNLKTHLQNDFEIVEHLELADHVVYKLETIEKIRKTFQKHKICILTTEKDMVKLLNFRTELLEIPIFYLPIEVYFLENEADFQKVINNFQTEQTIF